jgi:hypothetical protein
MIEIDENLMFIPGEQIRLNNKGKCYLSIFETPLNEIYLGNIFMANYYVVFDMTPKSERGEDYIQIGLAK